MLAVFGSYPAYFYTYPGPWVIHSEFLHASEAGWNLRHYTAASLRFAFTHSLGCLFHPSTDNLCVCVCEGGVLRQAPGTGCPCE